MDSANFLKNQIAELLCHGAFKQKAIESVDQTIGCVIEAIREPEPVKIKRIYRKKVKEKVLIKRVRSFDHLTTYRPDQELFLS